MRSRRNKKMAGFKKIAVYIVVILILAVGATVVWKPLPFKEAVQDNIKQLPWLGSDRTTSSQKQEEKTANQAPSEVPLSSAAPVKTVPASAGEHPLTETELARATGKVKAGEAMEAIMRQLNGTSLQPGQIFSFAGWLKKIGVADLPPESQLSYSASLLYSCVLQSGLEIGERYIHSDLPDYVEPGFDIAIEINDLQKGIVRKDLSFANRFDFPVTLSAEVKNGFPAVSLKAVPTDQWKKTDLRITKETFRPDEIRITDFSLSAGMQTVQAGGKDGILIKVYGDRDKDGKQELISKDFYQPHPVVLATGPSAEEADKLKTSLR